MRSRTLLGSTVALAAALWAAAGVHGQTPEILQFVFTSDSHYGITRPAFQGATNVDAHVVNAALVRQMNSLPGVKFPVDGGLREGMTVDSVDFVVDTGDIANRSEVTAGTAIQSAAISWGQFEADYLQGLTLKNGAGSPTPVYVAPGNHDASNAVGFYKPMMPPVDKTAMVEIYNRMMRPAVPKTAATFDYDRDKVLTSRDIEGVHFVFVTVWPDSMARAWMERDFEKVSGATPIVIFAHDQPDAEAKHFRNPNGAHGVTDADRFENLLADEFVDAPAIWGESRLEQRDLEAFLGRHPNVSAYFHGNSNWNQFYDWTGPRHSIALHTFRVDSPMKGAKSSADETKLSFQVATIDLNALTMTVRECLWDSDPAHPTGPVAWGASTTVALFPRPTIH
jgi:Calcineurin-like phosphoesterase